MDKIKKWKTLSSTYIHKSQWATLRKDVCVMGNGKVVDDYYVLEYPAFANALAITEDNKVLMVEQYRQAAGIVSLEIPGGVVDEGESPDDAIKRELLEETGYEFTQIELVSTLYPNPSTANNKCYCYLATGGKKVAEMKLDDKEELLVREYTLEEVKTLLFDNKIQQAIQSAGIFYALRKLGEL